MHINTFRSSAAFIVWLLANLLMSSALAQNLASSPSLLLQGNDRGSVSRIVLAPDGSTVFSGSFIAVDGTRKTDIARLLPNGMLDAALSLEFDRGVSDLLVDPSGKIYVSGFFARVNGIATLSPIRLNSDGSLDSSWSSTQAAVGSMALDSFGRLYVGGRARYLTNGTRDLTWAPNIGPTAAATAVFASKVIGDHLYIGGSLNEVNSIPRNGLHKFDTSARK